MLFSYLDPVFHNTGLEQPFIDKNRLEYCKVRITETANTYIQAGAQAIYNKRATQRKESEEVSAHMQTEEEVRDT